MFEHQEKNYLVGSQGCILNKEEGGVCVPPDNKRPTGIKRAKKQDSPLM